MFDHEDIYFHSPTKNTHSFNLFNFYLIYLIYLKLEQFCFLDFRDNFIRSNCQFVLTKYIWYMEKQPSTVLIKSCSENMQQIYRRTPMPKWDFNKVALQLYWKHTLAWVFSYKFAAVFQNSFLWEYLCRAASLYVTCYVRQFCNDYNKNTKNFFDCERKSYTYYIIWKRSI